LTTSAIKIRTFVRNSPNSTPSAEASYVALLATGIPAAVRWSFLLFVFALPFEATDLGFMTGSVSIPKLCGFLFFSSYLFHYGPLGKGSFPRFLPPMSWFLAYAVIFSLNGFLVDEPLLREFFVRCFTLMQLVMLFWIASDLLSNPKMVRSVLLSYSIASVLLAVGNILHLPGFYADVGAGRITGVGDNPNEVAGHLAIAFVTLIGLCLYTSYKRFLTKILLLVLTLPLMVVMVATGSRGGILAFVIGCLVYVLPHWRSKRTLTTIIVALLVIATVVYMVADNPYFSERWQEAYEGKLSGREQIAPAAIEMILERPVFGWQPIAWFYELGMRLGITTGKDAHNLVLALLLEVGVVGTIPFLIGLWLCARSAWSARSGYLELLPLALLFTVCAAGMSGTTLIWKTQWLVFALTLAAPSIQKTEFGTPFAIPLVRRRMKRRQVLSSAK
jgi:O-antigen ligase